MAMLATVGLSLGSESFDEGPLIILVIWSSVFVAWIWEGVGGVVIVVSVLIELVILCSPYADPTILVFMNLPFLASGVLFLTSWGISKESRDKESNTTTLDQDRPTSTAPDQSSPGINRGDSGNKDDIDEKGSSANTPGG